MDGKTPNPDPVKRSPLDVLRDYPASTSLALITTAGLLAKFTFAPDLAWTLILAPAFIGGSFCALYGPFIRAVGAGVFAGMRSYDIYNAHLLHLYAASQAEEGAQEMTEEEVEAFRMLFETDSPSNAMN